MISITMAVSALAQSATGNGQNPRASSGSPAKRSQIQGWTADSLEMSKAEKAAFDECVVSEGSQELCQQMILECRDKPDSHACTYMKAHSANRPKIKRIKTKEAGS
jgi:hypothetical protein